MRQFTMEHGFEESIKIVLQKTKNEDIEATTMNYDILLTTIQVSIQ